MKIRLYRLYIFLLLAVLCRGVTVAAQQQLEISTRHSSLLFNIGKDQKLYQAYFGNRITTATTQQVNNKSATESYIPAGSVDLYEPAVRIVHADGNPSLDLVVDSYNSNKVNDDNTITRIVLKDPVYPVTIVLYISAWYQEDVMESWTEITHEEKKPVRITNFASSMLHFNANDYWLTQFHGDWAKEMHRQESKLTSGIKIIDSKLGSRADMYQTPAFFLSLNEPATETTGELIAGTLAWTGNFQFLFELDRLNKLRVISGMNPYASDYVLEAGKKFTTPAFIFTWSNQGMGAASRHLHNWARNHAVLNGRGSRMTLLNNWETTQFDFNEKKLENLFDESKTLGVDMFLLDDGWFGNKYPRNDDHAGLGDWEPNKDKIPESVGRLVTEAQKRDVKFGIWIEPEMVNPKSELYEKHPDWVLKLPNRKEDYFRNQLVLDIINPQVQQFVYNVVDELLSRNPGIAYIKWDCNRMMTNAYSPYLKENQSNLYIDYVHSLYTILQNLRKKYPQLPMMLCSGGGGRTDYGALQYFTEFWPSDNTNPVDRVYIQWGYSYFFPVNTIACHITSWGNEPLKFRTDVAMMGRLGYDIDVSKMSPNDLLFSQDAIKNYKRLSAVIGQGNLYRLVDPYQNERAVLMYADSTRNHAVVFAYNLHARYGKDWTPVKLQGLDASKTYTVKEINLYPGAQSTLAENGKQFTGEYLMEVGLNVSESKELTSSVIEITAQADGQQKDQVVTMPFGARNKIVYNLQTGTYTVSFNGKETIQDAYALCKGNEAYDSRTYTQCSYTATPVNNGFGKGTLYTITSTGDNKLQQLFYVFPQKDYFITTLKLLGKGDACNYMSPVTADNVDLSGALGQAYSISERSAPDRSVQQREDNRALFVPFDNDMWVRYNAAEMSKADFTGSEVTALYDNNSNKGIVIGSLEHGVWKSGIQVHANSDTTLDRLTVFAGFTDSITTHDKVPHGKVKPVNGYCASPLVMVGNFGDWKSGMETYASLNRVAEPRKISPWKKPTPIGWNSWGVIGDKINLQKAKGVIDFFADSCKTFRTADHTLYIDLDSYWDNMTRGGIGGDVSELKAFVQYCRQKGFQPGIYWAPFVDWGKSERKIEGSNYSYGKSWTTQHGRTIDTDGGRAMDPTFPGTKDRIVYFINRFKELGFCMVKIDFLGHAAAEADTFYDPAVTTGMQAFRKGMEFLDSVLDNKMLVYAAISPNLATGRYVHMRRIGCDAFSAIDNTEYTLNSTGYGWWQAKLYDYIDADHVVFANGPENVNRARLISSVITGTLITGDDYAAAGPWRSTAIKLLQNQEILSLAKQVKRFQPVEANTGNKAVNIFEKQEGDNIYIAAINYDAQARTFVIPLERIGKHTNNWQAQELFSGRTLQGKGDFNITVNGSDAVIYKMLDK